MAANIFVFHPSKICLQKYSNSVYGVPVPAKIRISCGMLRWTGIFVGVRRLLRPKTVHPEVSSLSEREA